MSGKNVRQININTDEVMSCRLDVEFVVEKTVKLCSLVSKYSYLGSELNIFLLECGSPERCLFFLQSASVS